jgi:hypothetical protein
VSVDSRLAKLEQTLAPEETQPVRILVVRVPVEVPADERDAWVQAHPECVSKVVEVPRAGKLVPPSEEMETRSER